MITNLRDFDSLLIKTNSPCQYQRKYIRRSMENMDADGRE